MKTSPKDLFYACLRRVVRPFIRGIWIRETTGLEKVPTDKPAILAMNHQSYFDFLCMAVESPRNIHFLAAEKFFAHPLWRILMKATRQIKVDRLSHDKKEMHRQVFSHLEDGKLVAIFPEGTRSPHEHEMLKAFPGVARYALAKKVPIIPVGIKGTYQVMSKHDRRVRFGKHVSIHVGEPMHFKEYHEKSEISDLDHRTVAHSVMKEISRLSGKSYPHQP